MTSLLVACGPPGTPPEVATPVATAPTASPEPTAPEPTASAEPTSDPVAPPAPPPAATSYTDIDSSPGDAALEPGAALVKAGDMARAKSTLEGALPEIDKKGTLDARMAGHALLARACQSLKDTKCASTHYKTVRELWRDDVAAMKAIESAAPDEKEKLRRLGRALNAAGEALFHAAEEKRLAAEAEKMPVYSGSGKREDVLRHITGKIAPWVKARRAKVEEAEKEYVKIATLQPVPPPRWMIAAGAAVGGMWADFAGAHRSTPIPKEWKQSGPVPNIPDMTWEEVRKNFHDALEDAVSPLVDRARAAFMTCQSMSRKYAYQDAASKRCDDWLASNPKPAPAP